MLRPDLDRVGLRTCLGAKTHLGPGKKQFHDQRPPATLGKVDMAEIERQEQFFREQLPETLSGEAIAFLQDRDADLAKVKGVVQGRHTSRLGLGCQRGLHC
jgi:hypothetical protein